MTRWWWWRLRRRKLEIPTDDGGTRDAEQAHYVASRKLAATRRQQPEVDEVVRATRELRARNHFGEQIEQAMRRKGRPA